MEHMKLNWNSSCCRSNLILAGVRAVKNKKMKWSWVRTIILYNLHVYIKFWNCNDYAYHTVQMFVNDLRKYKHQYNEKKCRAWRPTVARWRGPGVMYYAWIILSYLMPSHFLGILSLGPCILFYFFRGSTPLWHHTRIIMDLFINNIFLYYRICLVSFKWSKMLIS